MPGPAPPPSRVRRSDFHRTRTKILTAARRLVAERGPESLTVSAVAHEAEINRTTAYQHFRTRDELVAAVTSELIAEVAEVLAASRSALGDRIDHIAEYFVERPEIARIALYRLQSDDPFPREAWEPYLEEMRRYRAAGAIRDDVDVEMLAQALMAVAILWPLHARAEGFDAAGRRVATARFARELKRLLLFGLFKPAAWPELVASLEAAPAERTRP
jgi:AcrR family transcriptional regulator